MNNHQYISHEEHTLRIRIIVNQWFAGEITIDRKRQLIIEENRTYYGPSCRPELLRVNR